MTTVAIARLKAALSEYVARVKAGEEVVLTDRGVPVAKLVPLSPQKDQGAAFAELIRLGQIRPPEKPLSRQFFTRKRRVRDPQGHILKGLLAERESGW
ncbi:MAG TPA: type II toxin-antitoxin system prevent-host-death family antitoxin [Phycisphaerae bacterium]|jgi:prevent-host-death family protein